MLTSKVLGTLLAFGFIHGLIRLRHEPFGLALLSTDRLRSVPMMQPTEKGAEGDTIVLIAVMSAVLAGLPSPLTCAAAGQVRSTRTVDATFAISAIGGRTASLAVTNTSADGTQTLQPLTGPGINPQQPDPDEPRLRQAGPRRWSGCRRRSSRRRWSRQPVLSC